MCSASRAIDMGFTKTVFPAGTHMCLIYSDEAERRAVISQFLGAGVAHGEKTGYFADTPDIAEVRQWLIEKGLDVPDTCWGRQLHVQVAEQTYCPAGCFDPETMLGTLRAFHEQAIAEGYPGSRVSGEMAWALRGIPGSERLIEYESRINDLVAAYPVTALCQYDANRFDGATILNVLRVHPMMVVHGQVVQNPYYVKPAEFLRGMASHP